MCRAKAGRARVTEVKRVVIEIGRFHLNGQVIDADAVS